MQRLALLFLINMLLLGTEAEADPDPEIQIGKTGQCPSAEVLRANLDEGVVFTEAATRWSLDIKERRGRAELQIVDHKTGTTLRREVRSKDCDAIAKAFAVIIHGYFVELEVLPNPADEQPKEVRPVVVETNPIAKPKPAIALPKLVSPKSSARSLLRIGAQIGLISDDLRNGRLGGGMSAAWTGGHNFGLRLSLMLNSVDSQRFDDEQVDQQGGRAELSAHYRLQRGVLGVQGSVGVGLALAQVEAIGIADSKQTRPHGFALGAADFSWAFADSWDLRLGVQIHTFFVVDQYVIDPFGPVASSPRVSVLPHLGIDWRWNPN